ncbi:MAG: hypothetical protein M1837_004003 [Sclerophora amabilis]|nr:MAG: hypothetical protein M1837_004003 [Sclerophora amabilis]
MSEAHNATDVQDDVDTGGGFESGNHDDRLGRVYGSSSDIVQPQPNRKVAGKEGDIRAAAPLRAKLSTAREKLATSREKVLLTRVEASQKRTELRRVRTEASKLEAEVMRAIDNYVANRMRADLPERLAKYEDYRKARNRLGPIEDDYNQLEDRLNQEEYELEREENRFYRRQGYHDSEHSAMMSISGSSTTDSTISAIIEYPPSAAQYLSRIGDANLVREALEDLHVERAAYLYREQYVEDFRQRHRDDEFFQKRMSEEEEIGKKFGGASHSTTASYLEELDKKSAKLTQQLHTMEIEIQQLKRAAMEQGELPREDNASEGSERLSLEAGKQYQRAPLLLPLEFDGGKIFPGSLSNSASSRQIINQWLLHMLQTSPLEVDQCKANQDLDDLDLDEHTWTNLVLKYWSFDEAAIGTPVSDPISEASDI